MLSCRVFVFLFLIFFNICNCYSHVIININTKCNDNFDQDPQQNPVNIFVTNYEAGKELEVKKVLKLHGDNTVDPTLNNNKKLNDASNKVNTTLVQDEAGKEQEIKKVLKLHDDNTVDSVLENSTKLNDTADQVNTTPVQNEADKVIKVRDDYTLYPGLGYYKYHNKETSWENAKHFCEQEGAHLVVINSQAEAGLVTGFIKTNSVSWIHVGFFRNSTNSELVTLLGGQVSDTGYVKWYPNYPSKDSGHSCGYMNPDGLLVNDPCPGRDFNFVCEIEL